MAGNIPFAPQGKSITLQTSGTINTSQNRLILPSDFALPFYPTQLLIISNGTDDIWIATGLTSSVTAVFPTAGTTTVGTPQPGVRLKPGAIQVFTLNCGQVLYLADISPTASQKYDLIPGEGM